MNPLWDQATAIELALIILAGGIDDIPRGILDRRRRLAQAVALAEKMRQPPEPAPPEAKPSSAAFQLLPKPPVRRKRLAVRCVETGEQWPSLWLAVNKRNRDWMAVKRAVARGEKWNGMTLVLVSNQEAAA